MNGEHGAARLALVTHEDEYHDRLVTHALFLRGACGKPVYALVDLHVGEFWHIHRLVGHDTKCPALGINSEAAIVHLQADSIAALRIRFKLEAFTL